MFDNDIKTLLQNVRRVKIYSTRKPWEEDISYEYVVSMKEINYQDVTPQQVNINCNTTFDLSFNPS